MVMPLSLRAPLELDVEALRVLTRVLTPARDAPWAIDVPGEVEGRIVSCVRGAWDLFLRVKAFSAGSEIIVSGINIRHMEEIVRAHGLVPVAADLDEATLLPSRATLQALCSERTVGVLVAHLFGTWSPLDDLAEMCCERGLFLVEDCAQAFMGRDFTGTKAATASLFSFGTIKRCTAFGGAVVFVRDAATRERMVAVSEDYPLQEARSFHKKVFKYLALKLLTMPTPYAVLVGLLNALRGSHEEVLRNAVRGFPGAQVPEAFRFRPCAPLRALLVERWSESGLGDWERRSRDMWAEFDRAGVPRERVAGHGAHRHTFWLVPLRSRHPDATMRVAAACGLDATRGVTSLSPVGAPTALVAASILGEMVYLPVHQRCVFELGEGLVETL